MSERSTSQVPLEKSDGNVAYESRYCELHKVGYGGFDVCVRPHGRAQREQEEIGKRKRTESTRDGEETSRAGPGGKRRDRNRDFGRGRENRAKM